ncbi:DUF4387 domain-containing protein [Paracoccus sp. M683]|uniref:DUF4387 domain-containing protein n=1 Tax=Paracoccus sp. M683 TaxID=2594268 RepID=UPI00117C2E8F|nr:DUF4387 domain-containing protein [Paracoccus sp. M683]TRW99344.1 DUF4387 domain-containing protein [Paracoccus sp. M683]
MTQNRDQGTLGDLVLKVRSKNAGPFWVTIDIFCDRPEVFARVRNTLSSATVAQLYQVPEQLLKRFDIDDLRVIKFSLPRPVIQGSAADRDMHGAQYAALLEEYPLT